MAEALFSLAGKRAVVTGASKGIGAAIAQLFAAAGADVAVLGRDHDGLAATKALVEAEGRRCWVVAADFSTAEGGAAAADELLGHAEAWDCLVNNHGANAQTPLAARPPDSQAGPGEGGFAFDGEAFSAVIDTNLRSVVQLTSRLVRTGTPPDPEPRHRSSWAEPSVLPSNAAGARDDGWREGRGGQHQLDAGVLRARESGGLRRLQGCAQPGHARHGCRARSVCHTLATSACCHSFQPRACTTTPRHM